MTASDEFLLGRIALQLGFLRPQQLAEGVETQQATKRPLGEILVEKGYLTRDQLDQALSVQKRNLEVVDPATQRRKEAILFGKLAVREGSIPEDSVNECLRLQALPGETRPLGEILVERGYLTSGQVQELLRRQVKRIMNCPACRLTFTVMTLTEGKSVRCPRCKGALTEARPEQSPRTDAEFATQVVRSLQVEAPKPPPAKPSRKIKTTCVICDTPFEGELDATCRIACPSCHSSFTPR